MNRTVSECVCWCWARKAESTRALSRMSLGLSETEGKCRSIKQGSSAAVPWTLWIRELFVLRVAVLCVVGCMSASLASIHEMPVINPTPTRPWQSVRCSLLVMSNSLQPHGLQHDRPPCPSPTPRACSKLMSIESVMPSNHLILCRPLLLLPSTFPSIRVFSNESALHIRWPKDWSFSFSISPSMNIHWNIHDNKISLNMATCPQRNKISPFEIHGHRWAKGAGRSTAVRSNFAEKMTPG